MQMLYKLSLTLNVEDNVCTYNSLLLSGRPALFAFPRTMKYCTRPWMTLIVTFGTDTMHTGCPGLQLITMIRNRAVLLSEHNKQHAWQSKLDVPVNLILVVTECPG